MNAPRRFIRDMRQPDSIFDDEAERADFAIRYAIVSDIQARLGYRVGDRHPPQILAILDRAQADMTHDEGPMAGLVPEDYARGSVAAVVRAGILKEKEAAT